MDFMSNNMGEYQTKKSPGRIMWENYKTLNPEKHDSSRRKDEILTGGWWALSESQRVMTQDEVKIYANLRQNLREVKIYENVTPWKRIFF